MVKIALFSVLFMLEYALTRCGLSASVGGGADPRRSHIDGRFQETQLELLRLETTVIRASCMA
jgi:hypothetical protein